MRFGSWFIFLAASIALVVMATGHAAAQNHKPPYYASIAAGRARMRTGPGRNYPAIWLYRRADLPIKVIDIYQDWRKIEDPDGTQGWMLVSLLSARRTAIVTGTDAEMREKPAFDANVLWRAAPGVVGRISDCSGGWCWFDVGGKAGYVEETHLWGVDPGEQLD
jgi:SH3-like domain-containing protein